MAIACSAHDPGLLVGPSSGGAGPRCSARLVAALTGYALTLIIGGATPAAAEGPWIHVIDLPHIRGVPESAIDRHIAARALVAAKLGDIGAAGELVCAWLAANPDSMQIDLDGSSGWRVTCPRSEEVGKVASLLTQTVASFGMPIVACEAERPSSKADASAALTTQSSLDHLGLRTVDGHAVRANRRAIADTAVARGLPEGSANAAIDELDGDFVARIKSAVSAPTVAPVYGVDIVQVESTLSVTVLHGHRESVVESLAASGRRHSRSGPQAQADADLGAARDAAVGIAAAIARDWVSTVQGRRPWLVEVLQPDPAMASVVSGLGRSDVAVLENRPGIRALIEVPGSILPDLLASGALGGVLQTRPGFVRVDGNAVRSDWRWVWLMTGVAGTSAGAALLLRFLRARGLTASER